jgi:retron-type reverse transcriptase
LETKDLVNRNIMDILTDINVLIAAYQHIKLKPGNRTSGSTSKTLDGINMPYFERLRRDLRTGVFKFQPSRRIMTSKSKGSLMNAPREKIVQMAITMILEAIYEPTFSTNSHGFLPNKGVHTALRQVKKTFTSVN